MHLPRSGTVRPDDRPDRPTSKFAMSSTFFSAAKRIATHPASALKTSRTSRSIGGVCCGLGLPPLAEADTPRVLAAWIVRGSLVDEEKHTCCGNNKNGGGGGGGGGEKETGAAMGVLDLESAGQYVWNSPRMYLQWWLNLVDEDPGHVIVETALIAFIVYILIFKKTLNPKDLSKPNLSSREIEEIIEDWTPEPLVPPLTEEEMADADRMPVVEAFEGPFLRVEGFEKPLLNMANFDFLGMGQRKELKQAAVQALDKYGCGSCGPRGFYGTIDVHMKIEEEVASFMGTEEAISYSDSATTISSAIPAFAKKGDLTIVDQGVEENVQTGINLSRSTVRTFKHNDMDDLERVLQGVAEEDKRLKRNVLDQRRFIVVEGLYRNYGDLCPLPRLLELKAKYCYRLILNEALSFGVLGSTGRGLTEMHGVDVREIEIVTMSMAHSLASVGGLCIGTTQVVDHQRLSAAGYCYSASAPPFVSAAASAALRMLRAEPILVSDLRKNAEFLHLAVGAVAGLKVTSCKLSPIVHVALTGERDAGSTRAILQAIAQRCAQGGVALTASTYIPSEKFPPPPTLRITTNALHTSEQLEEAVRVLASATAAELTAAKEETGSGL